MRIFRVVVSLFVRLYVSALSVALISGLYPDLVSAKPSCPTGQFRNTTSVPARCSLCSTCPINHIVRKPCSRQNDTVCGPFYEFEFFNHRQEKNGTTLLGEPPYFSKLGYRLTYNGFVQPGEYSADLSTTSISPDEAITVRCGQPQWRMLCYGLVAALFIVVSVVLTAFALFTYCRSSVKTIRLEEMSGVTRQPGVDDDSSVSSTIVVNRDVRHLEGQLIHNERRKAFLRWLFGSSVAADRLFSSNDYLDERHRRRFIRMLDGSSEPRGDVLPLEPYPGMTLTGRTDHRHPTQPDSNEGVLQDDGRARQLDSQTVCNSTGESSMLLPQETTLQIDTN